jgi:beta-phosphoglucomutase
LEETIMKYRAVIFDLDGVICHTDENHFQAWKSVAEDLGIPFDRAVNDRLRGVSRRESLEILLEAQDEEMEEAEKRHWTDRKNQRYRESLNTLTPEDLDPGVPETLSAIRKMGLLMAIGSSSKNATYILERLDLANAFDAISDGNGITKAKPDPEIFLRAAGMLGVPPEECLVVEDAKVGIEAAIAGGMDCAAIGDGTRYGLAQYNLDHITDLIAILEQTTWQGLPKHLK